LCIENTHGCSDICNYTGPGTFDCLCTDPLATLSGKTCNCPVSYLGNGRTCTSINQCVDNTHDCEDQCVYTGPGTYQCACSNPDAYLADNDCHCNQGYSGNGLTCLAISYCTEDTHGCSDVCNVTGPGTFDCLCTDPLATLSGKTCICPNGYSGNGRNCTVINYCLGNTHGCQDICDFIGPGVYQCNCHDPNAYPVKNTCVCTRGYNINGTTCNAINMCVENSHTCEDICIYTGPGDYQCSCNDPHAYLAGTACICLTGYMGINGTNCTAINQCTDNTHDCQEIWTFTGPGSYQCSCSDPNAFLVGKACNCFSGYTKNGTICTPINKCLDNTHNCQDFCTFTGPGTFQCSCSDPMHIFLEEQAVFACQVILVMAPRVQ
jgi:hypothetical protein